MIRIYFTFALILVFAASAIAQTSKKTTAKRGKSQKPRMVEMSDLTSDEICFEPDKSSQPYVGTIVKRQFDDDEITLTGITLREANDERYFINIDTEYVSSKGRFVPRELSSILTLKRRVKIWVYGCGASGRMLFISKVQAF